MPPAITTASPPKFQVLPNLPPEEFEALKEDIRCRGVQMPIEVTTGDEILDGHQRLRACE
jgi:ParB-like chromosome segregation protein Spo0J